MHKKIIFVLILLPFLILTIKGKSQSLKITNVTVINDLGYVKISWEYNGADYLGIFRDSLEISNLSPLTVITNNSIQSFIDSTAQANDRPRAYKIQSETNDKLFSDIVSTYYLKYDYDSCLQQINLEWNDLKLNSASISEWTPSQFIINIYEDGILRTKTVDASTKEYLIENLKENTNYNIFIETVWQGQDSTSYSNRNNLFTKMPASPEYIHAVSASTDGNNTNLKFEIDPNSELDTYKLLKADSPTGNFDTLKTIVTNDNTISITDEESDPDTKVSYYKLISINECGYETTNSDTINNIVLQVENNDYVNTLSWNSFKENSHISINYEVYRIVGNSDPKMMGNFSNSFQDDIEALQNYTQFCYYIRAKEQGASEYSQSNVACVYLNPKVYIPEAFTPNGDGRNDCFNVCGNFEVNSFDLRIYDRWGSIVFETHNFTSNNSSCDDCNENSWDGKDYSGNPVPTGSYIYLLKIKLKNEQIVEKRGNITVIYP